MFDGIRPYTPEELPGIVDELFDDPQFLDVVRLWYKDIPTEALRGQAKACKNNLEVQEKLFYPLVMQLMNTCAASLTLGYPEKTDKKARHTYVSNHRDIVLDSALLSILLLKNGFGNTVEIAIGDNLLIYPWIEKLVRVNKSFIVRRSVSMREKLESSRLMSQYMHFAIAEKHENIWIAQREGRAKDSDDRTQESVLKMMAMGGAGTPVERLMQLNIVPLSISYEYDPCDYLKAKEFQLKRDNPGYVKSRADDVLCFGAAYGKYSSDLRDKERGSYEIALELNYKFQINRFSFLQPNIQYIINTKGGEYPNALVLGMQFGLNL